jgi:hypothetical protein
MNKHERVRENDAITRHMHMPRVLHRQAVAAVHVSPHTERANRCRLRVITGLDAARAFQPRARNVRSVKMHKKHVGVNVVLTRRAQTQSSAEDDIA